MKRSFKATTARATMLALCSAPVYLSAAPDPSTADLDLLVGDWQVRWTYSPGTEKTRTVDGDLHCQFALNDQHIFCRYHFKRADQPDIVEHVYFNFNAIYDRYEAVWVSGTWPIKVLMSGDLLTEPNRLTLNMSSEFAIQDGVQEQVRSEMSIEKSGRLFRRTFIRTSASEDGEWTHHMTEEASRTN